MMLSILFGLLSLSSAMGEGCQIDSIARCDDLCAAELQSSVVQGIQFRGRLANFGCLDNSVNLQVCV